jgi:hypothetical protein
MIWESSYWKDDLLRQAKILRARINQKRWPQTSFAKVEQCLMSSFYAVRKLFDAKKLSETVISRSFRVTTFPSTGKPVHHLNSHHLERLYDFSKATQAHIGVLDLCNQFVHSYVFQLTFAEDGGLDGVFVTSDHKRGSHLYLVNIRQVISLFERIGQDYPAAATYSYDRKTGDYRIKLT